MIVNQIAEKYSQALFELTLEKEEYNKVNEELKLVVETINGHHDLEGVIYHPQISRHDKKGLVDKLFAAEISSTLLNFLKLLIDKRREKFIEAIADSYSNYVDSENKVLEVEATLAFELSSENEKKLLDKLSKITDREIRLKTQVDNQLLGGLILKIGDRVIDGSLKKELQSIRDEINKIEVSKLEVS